MTEATDPISVLLSLQHRIREAETAEELGFIIVNETHALAPYRQAILWREGMGVVTISGLSAPEGSTPFVLWLARACRGLAAALPQGGRIDPGLLSERDRAEWSEWFPPHGFWLPLNGWGDRALGGVLLVRDGPWSDQDQALLNEIGHAYGHALSFFQKSRGATPRRKLSRLAWGAVVGGVALASLLPVPLTVLAPAELVAAHPAVVRSPLDGVIDKFHIAPNAQVREGQLLFDLDATTLIGKLEVAEKTLSTAEAEYRLTSQQAVFDPAAKSKLMVLSGRMEERAAEAAYLRGLLERIKVKAPRSGLAVLDDPSEWIGRPVSIGERVMSIADERDTEIEAWLAVGDAVDLDPGMKVTVFLNADPLHPVRASLRFVGYEAQSRSDSTVAYRLRATLMEEGTKPRLGLKGTARIEAGRVPILYWLVRRPLAAVRHMVGF
ncbi:hypothetical protein CU669_19370 [Paramagnetospirillum kuznetsovii]|uniref:Membrane fusion protein biotin-lipoyl like domain-containing protein n=1 Tax=Paramagnetospirillum kuznetsovii TaxID=2053833 RepID=A0A364NT73_9PROT|nr:HlyD family efflux transporter periplasmic adaptor subunit [Paramagnetospirillum kuznetsovii]RAU20268.1 hypothetical protein CU669_19370 [Paramagnetospirillum kuznetsovii]